MSDDKGAEDRLGRQLIRTIEIAANMAEHTGKEHVVGILRGLVGLMRLNQPN